MKDIELLAPAGGIEALQMAVMSGADAVYIGGKFSARSETAVFTTEEMKSAIDFCHLYGVKVHVAVNTLIKENEIDVLGEYIKELCEMGVDAVIVQDIGAAGIFRTVVPSLELHASTQMTVTSLSGVKYLEENGFSRVVLARELSEKQITHICKNSKAEIEVFVHGALCMCYSGQCLMSSIIGGRSGNRGKCAQPCRLPYEIISHDKVQKNGYLLSPKDLSLFDELEKIRKAGVDSLKIEGRLKRAEYVGTVVGTFRRCLDRGQSDKNDYKELLDAFNRGGFTKSYFKGERGKSMMSGANPGNIADGVYPERVKKILNGTIKRTVPVRMYAEFFTGMPLKLKVTDGENTVEVKTDIAAEPALNKPIDRSMLSERLSKTGGTCFEAVSVDVNTDEISIIPAKEINALRRLALEKLSVKRMEISKREIFDFEKTKFSNRKNNIMLSAEVNTSEQAKIVLSSGIKRIYADKNIIDELGNREEFVEKLPQISHEQEIAENKRCLVSGIGQWYDNSDKDRYVNYRMNVTNSYTVREFKDAKCICVSPELNLKEIKAVAEKTSVPLEIIGYGRLTLMTMANCPLKAAGVCRKENKSYRLRDRKKQEFLVMCGKGCIAELINSKPLYMADKWSDIKKSGVDAVRLVFTVEDAGECERVCRAYSDAFAGNAVPSMQENTFTRGHFYRGVL